MEVLPGLLIAPTVKGAAPPVRGPTLPMHPDPPTAHVVPLLLPPQTARGKSAATLRLWPTVEVPPTPLATGFVLEMTCTRARLLDGAMLVTGMSLVLVMSGVMPGPFRRMPPLLTLVPPFLPLAMGLVIPLEHPVMLPALLINVRLVHLGLMFFFVTATNVVAVSTVIVETMPTLCVKMQRVVNVLPLEMVHLVPFALMTMIVVQLVQVLLVSLLTLLVLVLLH